MNGDTLKFIDDLKSENLDVEVISKGSSLKFCLVVENKADIYPRIAPTSEWDTCAAHAVVKYAGGNVINYDTEIELVYNKENLLNPFFICI